MNEKTNRVNMIWNIIFAILAVTVMRGAFTPGLNETRSGQASLTAGMFISLSGATTKSIPNLYGLTPEELGTYGRTEVVKYLKANIPNVRGRKTNDSVVHMTGIGASDNVAREQTTGITLTEHKSEQTFEVISESEQTDEWVNLGEFTLSAYCLCVRCCGIWSYAHPSRVGTDYVQLTKSGTVPTAGRTVGANPEILPYGTVILIDGQEYTVEDSGGASWRNKYLIDIMMQDHQAAIEFGKNKAEVWIKK